MKDSFEGSETSRDILKKAAEFIDSNEALQNRIAAATSPTEVRAAVMESFEPPLDPSEGVPRRMTSVERATLLEAIRRWNKKRAESHE